MHDFNCTDAAEMNFPLMAERTKYLKEKQKGVSEVCRVLEEMCMEERMETMIGTARRMLEAGKYALEEIASISGLPLEEVKKLNAEHTA